MMFLGGHAPKLSPAEFRVLLHMLLQFLPTLSEMHLPFIGVLHGPAKPCRAAVNAVAVAHVAVAVAHVAL